MTLDRYPPFIATFNRTLFPSPSLTHHRAVMTAASNHSTWSHDPTIHARSSLRFASTVSLTQSNTDAEMGEDNNKTAGDTTKSAASALAQLNTHQRQHPPFRRRPDSPIPHSTPYFADRMSLDVLLQQGSGGMCWQNGGAGCPVVNATPKVASTSSDTRSAFSRQSQSQSHYCAAASSSQPTASTPFASPHPTASASPPCFVDDAHPMAAARPTCSTSFPCPPAAISMRVIPEERFRTSAGTAPATASRTSTSTNKAGALPQADGRATEPESGGGLLAATWPSPSLQLRRRRLHGKPAGGSGLSFRMPLGSAWTVMEGMATDEDTTSCGLTFSDAELLLEEGTALNMAAAAAKVAGDAEAAAAAYLAAPATTPTISTAVVPATPPFVGTVPVPVSPSFRTPGSPSGAGRGSRRRSSTPPPARTRSGSFGKSMGALAGKVAVVSTQAAKLRTTLRQLGATG